ncbi:MAG: guanylate kinase, partial [Clostridia bacterium]|nr:guanylate kinase [Clostridia bacterium]
RLKGRGSETEETIKKRMAKAEIELGQIDKYDFVVVNDLVENAVKQIESIMGRK